MLYGHRQPPFGQGHDTLVRLGQLALVDQPARTCGQIRLGCLGIRRKAGPIHALLPILLPSWLVIATR